MKKILLLPLFVMSLSASNCGDFLKSANNDFKEADKRWNSQSEIASQYASRGEMYYLLYMDCSNKEMFKELRNQINELKNSLETKSGSFEIDENIGTGY